jgi:hypothetical protein
VTLAKEIADIVARGAGTMQLWDNDVSLTVALDLNLTADAWVLEEAEVEALRRRAYGTIGLFVDSVYLQQDDLVPQGTTSLPASGHLVLPSQQVFIAFAHWFAVLAQQAHAAFGFGYDPGDDLTDEDAFVEESDEAIEAAPTRRQVPTLGAWLARERVTYVSSTLVTPSCWQGGSVPSGAGAPWGGGGGWSRSPHCSCMSGVRHSRSSIWVMWRCVRVAWAHQRPTTSAPAPSSRPPPMPNGAVVSRSNLKRLAQFE